MSNTMGDEGIVDVEKRKQSIEYNFGDPTLFPPEFLVWLKRFLEQSGLQLPASAIFGSLTPGGGSGSLRNIAAGVIIPFGGGVAPAGSIPCNGQLELINDYPKLHDILGATWGPQTATTFTVPDLRDRSLYGAGSLPIAGTDGRAAGSRGPSHHHDVSLATDSKGGHSHGGGVGAGGGHGHSGGVDGDGGHGHTYNISGPNYVTRQQGTAGAFFDPVDSLNYSSAGVGGSGGHGHGLHIDAVGDHGHSIASDGVHTHAVAGSSSGGGGVNTPGYAVLLYVITTG